MPLAYDHPALAGTGVRGAWLALRALHAVTTGTGWMRYVANVDRTAGAHVLDIRQQDERLPHHRAIYRGEVWWWLRGFAAGRSQGAVLDALTGERPAQVLPVDDALAERLGLSVHGLRHRVDNDRLYAVYVVDETDHRVRRHIPASQVAALTRPSVATEKRWAEVRALLPDQPRPESISERITLRPSPSPLPVGRGLRTPVRQREALALAREHGWISEFRAQADRSFVVTLPAGELYRLPTTAVEPFLLGLGDGRGGLGRLVAYRDDLG